MLLALLLLAASVVHAAYDPEIEAVQRELTERGYNPGTIDGAMGRRTRGALREFQRSAGIPDTGDIDDATRAALGLAPGAGTKRAPEGSADSTGADDTARTESATEPETGAPKDETARAEPAAVPETDAPKAEAARTELVIVPETDAPKAEAPREEPAAVPEAVAPKAEAARIELVIVPDTVAPKADAPRAEPAAVPETDAPKAEAVRTELVIVPDTGAPKDETARAEPAAVPEDVAPKAEAARTELVIVPDTVAPTAKTARAEPATAPQAPAPKAEAAPVRAPRLKLDFATLGWHRPQTGAQALARSDAIGAPPEFKRGRGTLFVPKGEFVFVLKAGERVPGLDCDPGAGRLSIEFVFGPDGPVIFTPTEGGEFCQTGIGIAIEVGRTLEIRRVDWGDTQLPPGTVRVTGQGLEYIR